MNTQRILIVEDEAIIAADLERRVRGFGYETVGVAATGHEACDRAAKSRPDLVLMDIVLKGDMDGIQATRWIRGELDIPVVYLTSHTDATTVNKACSTEPFGYILKPIDERELKVGIELALCRHRSEARVRQMERWLTTTLNSIGDGVVAVDSSGRVALMNPFAQQLTGWTMETARGRTLDEVLRLRDAATGESVPGPATRALIEGVAVQTTRPTLLQPREGPAFFVDNSASPIRGEKGEVWGAVVVFRDATERIRSEERMRGMNSSLEQQVARRTRDLRIAVEDLEQFTDSVSHDMRGPLMAIQGLASMLGDRIGAADVESASMLRGIQDSVTRMERMLGAFERLARVQNHEAVTEEISMDALVKDCLAELTLTVRSKAPVIEVKALPGALGDPQLLRQVWVNLVSNAIKYSGKSAQPRIEISGREEPGECVYRITDNGVGFDMKHADRLFNPFQRLHSSKEFEGHGIGLATAKRIVDRHGGRIWAESTVGKGATFLFAIPRARGGARAGAGSLESLGRMDTAAEACSGAAPQRILIVEDQAIVAADLRARLTRMGYQVVGTTPSGEEALEVARRLRPGLVLMDIQLGSSMDGVEASARIGDELGIPIVYLTAHSDPRTFDRAKRTRPLGYVVKPFQDRDLTMAIELALCRSESERKMADSERWLHATLRSIAEGVIATDARGRIMFMNPAAEALTGWKELDVLGRDLARTFQVLDPATGGKRSSRVAAELRAGKLDVCTGEAVFVTAEGVQRPILESGARICAEDGNAAGSVLVLRDIAEIKAGEVARERIITELRSALDQVTTLRRLLPVCAWCRKVRDDDGYWRLFDDYVRQNKGSDVTHGICPTCAGNFGASPPPEPAS